MAKLRQNMVTQMQKWLGAVQGDAKHFEIIGLYNSQVNPPRGVRMNTSYAWCAATVSAAAISCGYTDIIPVECSCGQLIKLAQKMGIWQENDAYVPNPGDLILYDWGDNGIGDDTTGHDHVGLVEKCDGLKITTIEGNYSNKCQRRTIAVNNRYIRGFITPKYDDGYIPTVPVLDPKEITGVKNDQLLWDLLYNDIQNEFGVAGLMGNLSAESVCRSNNLQDSGNKALGLTDEEYTAQIDAGTRNFIDNKGYGLAQWTAAGRKQRLLEYARKYRTSIGDFRMQVVFLLDELKTKYPTTYKVLKEAKSVEEASNRVLIYYEAPASKDSPTTQRARANKGQLYYDTYAKRVVKPTPAPTPAPQPITKEVTGKAKASSSNKALAGTYEITIDNFHIRDGAGQNKPLLGTVPKGTKAKNYGFYSTYSGTKWLYCVVEYQGVRYTGFCHSGYMKKV